MLKIKIKKPFSGYSEGEIVSVEADSAGIPIDQFWRKRLKDSSRDGAVEIVKPSKKPKSKNPVKEGSKNADSN